jgi:pyruvate dehydrogenase E2 component (dihydrolipoamide acetyltransferase)
MPKWGIEMVEGTISEWNISEGEPVIKGQVIAQIETDKIVNEVQVEYDTRFVRLIATPGEAYPVGALLAVTSSETVSRDEIDAFVRAFKPAGGDAAAAAAEAQDGAAAASKGDAAAASRGGGAAAAPSRASAPVDTVRESDLIPPGTRISPAARELALKMSVPVSSIQGGGRGGRITLQDVAQASKPARPNLSAGPVSIMPTAAALDGIYASPYAKRLAVKHGIDITQLTGTGPRGRISRRNVADAGGIPTDAVPRAAAFEVLRMSPTRKAIALKLTLSKTTIPHFYLRQQVTMDALLALRSEAKREGAAPSVNDYLIRATALALMAAPDVNVQVHGDEIHRFRDADISVAVATDKGLITPVIRAAQGKSVSALSAELRALAERARAGKLRGEEIEGGSFTVSNLGMFGIDEFDAIINPPQGAILAIGAARLRPIERGGGLSVAHAAILSLSCDHRAIDGAVGAAFLRLLSELIESPHRLF